MKPEFHVTQNSSLIDTTLEIRINNLPPSEVVTLKAEMCDNIGMKWGSFAKLISPSLPDLNLANDPHFMPMLSHISAFNVTTSLGGRLLMRISSVVSIKELFCVTWNSGFIVIPPYRFF